MVWYFVDFYIINRTLHGRLEIQNFSSRVEKIFHSFASKGNFVSPRGHVISSIFFQCMPVVLDSSISMPVVLDSNFIQLHLTTIVKGYLDAVCTLVTMECFP